MKTDHNSGSKKLSTIVLIMVFYTARLRHNEHKKMVKRERQNRSLLKSLRIAQAEGNNWGKSLFATLQRTEQLLTLSQEYAPHEGS